MIAMPILSELVLSVSHSVMSDSYPMDSHEGHQAPLSMEFSRQEHWSGLPCPPPRDLPNPGIEPMASAARVLQADPLPLSCQGSPSEPGEVQSVHSKNEAGAPPVHALRHPPQRKIFLQ